MRYSSLTKFPRHLWVAILFLSPSVLAQMPDLRPTVILISIDGFRYDYFGKAPTPNLDSLIVRGVRAEYMQPSFPTKTFPNHYTIATGLYPAHHGIVANNMWDEQLQARFKASVPEQVGDPRWWAGEPIWVTAQKAGQKTAPLGWPGSEAPIGGIRPTYWERYNENTTIEKRVNQLLTWLDLPGEQRPSFLSLYLGNVDAAGHEFGPDSPQVCAAITRADEGIGLLLKGLRSRGLEGLVNIVVVSDHGMAATSRDRLIFLDDHLDMTTVEVVDLAPVLAIKTKDGNNSALIEKLKRIPHLTVYSRETVPARFHFRDNPRITPVIAIADVGWEFMLHEYIAKYPDAQFGGDHGYDNAAPEMRAIFVAAGPAFKPRTALASFANVDVYPLLAHLLNVTPAKNDGTLKPFTGVLQPKQRAAATR